ncbi:MAG: GNAT family N-acetyltransferase [Acidimicrobiia bacterium]
MTLPIQDTTIHDTGLTVRKATGEDRSALVDTLTVVFHDDPVMTWWIPDPQRRPQILRRFFEVVVDVNQPHDELYLTEPQPVSTAIWVPPGCQPSGEAAEQMVTWMIDAAAETADRLLAALERMDQVHPHDSHAYLFFLATLPQWQSRGIGSAVMREVLDRCDRDRTPAYLEATTLDSQRLYLRHGFEVTGEILLPDGPSMWPMWREPQGR